MGRGAKMRLAAAPVLPLRRWRMMSTAAVAISFQGMAMVEVVFLNDEETFYFCGFRKALIAARHGKMGDASGFERGEFIGFPRVRLGLRQ